MGSIPNYLRRKANKFKGDVTEKVALNLLKEKGFICHEFKIYSDLQKRPEELEDFLERVEESQKKYQAKLPPKGLEWDCAYMQATWEEYRKSRLEIGKRRIKNVKNAIKRLKGHRTRLRKKWGLHLDNLLEYYK